MNKLFFTLTFIVLINGCASTTNFPLPKPQSPPPRVITPTKIEPKIQSTCPTQNNAGEAGLASYYHDNLNGNKTASGERYNKNDLTAAHRTLKFGTKVCVTNPGNSQSVVVRINDRGPHVKGRIIDLSRAAARQIGLIRAGKARVRLQILR